MINERERLQGQSDLAYALEPLRIYSSQALKAKLGCSMQEASNLWYGRVPIGGKWALRLSEATGLPAEVFLRIGQAWRDQHPSVKRKAG